MKALEKLGNGEVLHCKAWISPVFTYNSGSFQSARSFPIKGTIGRSYEIRQVLVITPEYPESKIDYEYLENELKTVL